MKAQIAWPRVFVEGVVIVAHAVRGESRLSRGLDALSYQSTHRDIPTARHFDGTAAQRRIHRKPRRQRVADRTTLQQSA